MAKAKKTRLSSLIAIFNERNIMILLAILLFIGVIALVVKEQKTSPKLDSPVLIEQSATEGQ